MNKLLILRAISKRISRYWGGRWLCNFLENYFSSNTIITVDDFGNGAYFACYLNEHIASKVFWRGGYSLEELDVLRRLIKKDCIFIDIGANQGAFAIFVASYCPNGKVVAFEPLKANYEKLIDNIRLNHYENVIPLNIGISEIRGNFPIYGESHVMLANEGLPSLFPRTGVNHYLEDIETIPLDEVSEIRKLSRIDLMKIDVEGAELSVLKSAQETIMLHYPLIMIELNNVTCSAANSRVIDVVEWLESHGYKIFEIKTRGRVVKLDTSNVPEYCNCIALPEAHIPHNDERTSLLL